jgi:hypothetical protein
MPDMLIAPYIVLREPVTVGPWQLTPANDFGDRPEIVDEPLRRAVARMIDAYNTTEGRSPFGALIYPTGGVVGSAFKRSEMEPLKAALLGGTISSNPRMAVGRDEQPANGGWMTATSENALLFGHPIDAPGNSYALSTGIWARVMSLHHADDDEPLPKIPAPLELPRPTLGARFDDETADAVMQVLARGDQNSRRLQRALDWYRVMYANADSIANDVRVGATRSALEVLTGAGDQTKKVLRAVGRLLDHTKDPSARQLRTTPFYKQPVEMTEPEWWFARLSELRNAITHGDEVPHDLWIHQGHHILNWAHDILMDCLRATLAAAVDDSLLLLAPRDRTFPRIEQRVIDRLKEQEAAGGDR